MQDQLEQCSSFLKKSLSMQDQLEQCSSFLKNSLSNLKKTISTSPPILFVKSAAINGGISIAKSHFVRKTIQTNLAPFIEDYVAELKKLESAKKDFKLKINGYHAAGLGFPIQENTVGLNFDVNKFNPTVNFEFGAKVIEEETQTLSIGMEYTWKDIPIPIKIPMLRLEIPMDGLLKTMYEYGGNRLTVSGGLRAGKLIECTASLCIGNPTTIGGALAFDFGWINASIQVKHKGMQLNGGWAHNNEMRFYIQMKHSSEIEESVTMFGITKPENEFSLNTQLEILAKGEGKILRKDYKLRKMCNWMEKRVKLQWEIEM